VRFNKEKIPDARHLAKWRKFIDERDRLPRLAGTPQNLHIATATGLIAVVVLM
jgi:fructose-bisphosphate aldolase class 1